jgi:hypothetical protein
VCTPPQRHRSAADKTDGRLLYADVVFITVIIIIIIIIIIIVVVSRLRRLFGSGPIGRIRGGENFLSFVLMSAVRSSLRARSTIITLF